MTDDGVTIHWGHLDGRDANRFEPLLAADERDRAASFKFARDGERYVIARGLLRGLLAERLAEGPARIRFAYGERGKPRLAQGSGLRFNLSHSHGVVAIALCEGREVGVDVEARHDRLRIESIARRFLPPQVVSEMEGTGADRSREFFRAWVRQEAYAKGRGAGLELLGEQPEGWSIADLDLLEGFAAAVAVEGPPVQVGTRQI
ncbi:MAG TPA: 4'-phosphopantetheinyl transferase superfamily protein [Solirubrobacterales bacterium]|nr:4'-phosphopantetheinyl transferase superfamily protein [Solirubrobacterales bacterium]